MSLRFRRGFRSAHRPEPPRPLICYAAAGTGTPSRYRRPSAMRASRSVRRRGALSVRARSPPPPSPPPSLSWPSCRRRPATCGHAIREESTSRGPEYARARDAAGSRRPDDRFGAQAPRPPSARPRPPNHGAPVFLPHSLRTRAIRCLRVRMCCTDKRYRNTALFAPMPCARRSFARRVCVRVRSARISVHV